MDRRRSVVSTGLAAGLWSVLSVSAMASPDRHDVVASLRLYNSSGWESATTVEVPTGSFSAPGLIDWAHVRLVNENGRPVPFSIREGRPHWRAALVAPLASPRAEDLLVFDVSLRQGTWTRLDLVPGDPEPASAIVEENGRTVVAYPGFRVTIDPTTAMLVGLEAGGVALLREPLTLTTRTATGPARPGPDGGRLHVRPVARSTSAAMTELHYVIDAADRLSLGVTYRVHRGGLIEIETDEQPWQGRSPWLDHEAEFRLRLAGEPETLPELVNRAPFYGFKDYAAVVKHTAQVYRHAVGAVVALGVETTNGRRWVRRLFVVPASELAHVAGLVQLATEGPVVAVEPRRSAVPARDVVVAGPAGTEVPGQRIVDALTLRGVQARRESSAANPQLTLRLVEPAMAPGISGDGFEIRPEAGSERVIVSACTRFGLMQAAWRIADDLHEPARAPGIPLVAGNPAARLRGAGFGGGDVEVDFPYGNDAEWHQAFESLVASGMNVMTDLGMWSDWKMPVSYREMPELRSDRADAYDEVSGARFSEFARHRDRGLRLLEFLHQRGVKVWLWLPTGCVPTTYSRAHPEAMAPRNDRCPCFTHPLYERYLEALLKELLETYPIDGLVMIRDDNGGLCSCERCKELVARSATKSAAWEQYLILYRWLKSRGFKGDIAVYPYNDPFEPRLEPLLPADLLIVGHGSGAGMLVRSYETLAPMGDTWLDNVFAGFRVPTTARMKRLLDGRNSFWLGGALRGSEVPWQTLGRLGWEPTATVNTLRYEWAARQFPGKLVPQVVALLDRYESLWELYDLPLLPQEWVKLAPDRRKAVSEQGRARLEAFRQVLETVRAGATGGSDAESESWLRHMQLFATYFEYHLGRLERITQLHELAVANRARLLQRTVLSGPDRARFLALNHEIDEMAARFDREMALVPGTMLSRTRAARLTLPYREFVNGYDALEWSLEVRQFAGALNLSVGETRPGKPFVLRIELQNRGLAAWTAATGLRLQLGGDANRLGLPAECEPGALPLAFGDRSTLELKGTVPSAPGEARVEVTVLPPFRTTQPFLRGEINVRTGDARR